MLHAADGVIQIERLGFVGADADRTVWLYSGLWCLMALSVVVLDWNTWRAGQPIAANAGAGNCQQEGKKGTGNQERLEARHGGSNAGKTWRCRTP